MGLKFNVLNLLPHCTSILGYTYICYRGVAQLVARTAGGREVASSSLVTPTKKRPLTLRSFSFIDKVVFRHLNLCL